MKDGSFQGLPKQNRGTSLANSDNTVSISNIENISTLANSEAKIIPGRDARWTQADLANLTTVEVPGTALKTLLKDFEPQDLKYRQEIFYQSHERIQRGTVTCRHYTGKGQATESVEALFDTGASTNFVGHAVLGRLLKQGVVKKSDIIDHETPLRVRFADQEYEDCPKAFLMLIDYLGNSAQLQFTVSMQTNGNQLIVGNGGMCRLKMPVPFAPIPPVDFSGACLNVISTQGEQTAFIEVVPGATADKKASMARLPPMESAQVYPIRVPMHSRSMTQKLIMAKRLKHMIEIGHVERTTLERIAVLENCILVDKKKAPDGTAPPVDPNADDLHSRFRCTLGAVTVNDMVLVSGKENHLFVRRQEAGGKILPTVASLSNCAARRDAGSSIRVTLFFRKD